MNYKASTQSNVKWDNQKMILQMLLEEGPLSRADLSKKLQSSKPTISKNVEELIQNQCIIEIGKADNMVGKKGILLDINPDYGYVMAIDMSKNQFRIVVSNLRKEWLCYKKVSMNDLVLLEKTEDFSVADLIKDFLVKSSVDINRIRQVSIAYPGVVGHNDTYYLTNLKEKELLLKKITPYIKERLKKPIVTMNDVNLAAIAEKEYGNFSHMKNLYLMNGDVGIGIGIIINHDLYEGDRNAAGEVGFVLPSRNKEDDYDTLEERISVHALLNRYNKETASDIDYDGMVHRLKLGDQVALKLYDGVLSDLSVAITNVASVLDIQTVVVTGRLFRMKDSMLEELNDRVKAMTPFKTDIHHSSVQKKSLKGAIIVGTMKIIESMVDSKG